MTEATMTTGSIQSKPAALGGSVGVRSAIVDGSRERVRGHDDDRHDRDGADLAKLITTLGGEVGIHPATVAARPAGVKISLVPDDGRPRR